MIHSGWTWTRMCFTVLVARLVATCWRLSPPWSGVPFVKRRCDCQRWFPIGVPDLSWVPASIQLVRKKEGFNPPLRFALTEVNHAHGYLAERGIDRTTAAEFGVGFYARPGLMSGRIVIPI